MDKLITSDWAQGKNWSERIWFDRDIVGEKLTNVLEKGITQGTSLQKMARELKDVTGNSYNNAFRLIRTESSYINGQVTLEGYKEAQEVLGLEYYVYDAFLDSRTSKICRELDKKHFRIDDAKVGVNFPPMHPNCRSTTTLELDEDYREEEDFNIDFSKDNNLPNFKKDELKRINNILKEKGIDTIQDNKPILFKQGSVLRNKEKHSDILKEEYTNLIKQALYNPVDINLGRKPGYLEFLGDIDERHHSSVVIDTKDENNVFAVVHVHKKRKKT